MGWSWIIKCVIGEDSSVDIYMEYFIDPPRASPDFRGMVSDIDGSFGEFRRWFLIGLNAANASTPIVWDGAHKPGRYYIERSEKAGKRVITMYAPNIVVKKLRAALDTKAKQFC